jgi:hypothetical protein
MGLKYGVDVSNDVRSLAKELKETYKLTDFESLTLALKAEQNELFKLGFVISSSDKYPSALEAIAISLGYSK